MLLVSFLAAFHAARGDRYGPGSPTAKGIRRRLLPAARLVERVAVSGGSITAFYNRADGSDDQQDPLVDAVRSLLDGHRHASRDLAAEAGIRPSRC